MGTFYWHGKTENGSKLKDELLNMSSVNNIKIATAYFSNEGLAILKELKTKFSLTNNNISIYLSPEFSLDKPHELLQELLTICNTYIVYDLAFHPKVYWLKGTTSKLLFGSSNFTNGGFNNNIEFDSISDVSITEETKLNNFFDYCNSHSKAVDAKIIESYKNSIAEIEQLKGVSKQLKKKLYLFEKKDDPFDEDEYDLTNYYFTFEDYETLFPRFYKLNDINIRNRRVVIKNKLLGIQRKVNTELNKLNLYCHWNPKNITSLIEPNQFNHNEVTWVGVRYGKHKKEVDAFNSAGILDNDDAIHFQKHACLQYSISGSCFQINLFHAVSGGAIDRWYLTENLSKLAPKIEAELAKLKGNGLKWVIFEYPTKTETIFDLNTDDPKDFINFYKKNDKDGRESLLEYRLNPNDPRLKDINSISKVIVETCKLLLPLYNLVALRPPV
jgi:hypothetical protein